MKNNHRTWFYISNKPQCRRQSARMRGSRDFWLFALTLASAASALVSIAAAETLLALAFLVWLLFRPGRIIWPSYTLPLCAFMATTVISLAMSPQPELGLASVRKCFLSVMHF